jgi:uncharacterized protein YdhG (YjbR/CyaY superfamily)
MRYDRPTLASIDKYSASITALKPQSVEDYICSKPPNAQQRLQELQGYLKATAPEAQDLMKWGKPALVDDGILFVYAATKNHISLHPTPSVVTQIQDQLGSHEYSENTIKFPISEPIPKTLVTTIAELRVFEKNSLGIKWR